ncbi:hypothetical protein HPO_12985 [Hyphomonas polymorpha PS728]|uniref:Uncharacterized protein n=1 Tax=Hyphomonas polymorpha PS728 TaxID=1280954 RepID=A0A062VGW7_9PROT|nr:hypothetical protein [Hyphomonas polymorpha]KCZ97770.1 hypothetical protein HPO_12985 [Hyphomonas polymorpha PS728]
MAKKPQPKQQQPQGRKPTHRLYRVVGDGKLATWTPIGAAWPNKDGMGFSIQLDAIPREGRVMLRVITEKVEGEQQ